MGKFDEIIAYLKGTCLTLHEVLETFNAIELENSDEFMKRLDDEIFYCDECGWWCPVYDQIQISLCRECADIKECFECGQEEGYCECEVS